MTAWNTSGAVQPKVVSDTMRRQLLQAGQVHAWHSKSQADSDQVWQAAQL